MANDLLHQAISLSKACKKTKARRLLEALIDEDPRNERAWIWMSDVVDSDYEREQCLKEVLAINPNNQIAHGGLRILRESSSLTGRPANQAPSANAMELPPSNQPLGNSRPPNITDLQQPSERVDSQRTGHDQAQLFAAFERIGKRCADAGITEKVIVNAEGGVVEQIEIPNGRDTRLITISSFEQAQNLLSSPFEWYQFLANYEAICSSKDGIIEAAIGSIGSGPWGGSGKDVLSDLQRAFERDVPEIDFPVSESAPITGERHVVIKPMSQLLHALFPERPNDRPSLFLIGFMFSGHDEAVELLEQVSNSLFFEIERNLDLTFGLRRVRPSAPSGRQCPQKSVQDLELSLAGYDQGPIELYWFARSAYEMPHLQFLAYYQTIEWYFPRDPNPAESKSEQSLLMDTLGECLDLDSLRTFLIRDNEMKEFFSGESPDHFGYWTRVDNSDSVLLYDVAKRIKIIRNAVVHSKHGTGGANVRNFLPLSREPRTLKYDIALIRYVAREVLVYKSKARH